MIGNNIRKTIFIVITSMSAMMENKIGLLPGLMARPSGTRTGGLLVQVLASLGVSLPPQIVHGL